MYSGRKGNADEEVAEEEHEEVDNDISQEEKKTLILEEVPWEKHEHIDDNLEESDDKDTEKWQIFIVDRFLILIVWFDFSQFMHLN